MNETAMDRIPELKQARKHLPSGGKQTPTAGNSNLVDVALNARIRDLVIPVNLGVASATARCEEPIGVLMPIRPRRTVYTVKAG